MRHAEVLTDRILFLDGLPNYQRLFPLRIGQTIIQMFQANMAVETEAVDRLRQGIEYMRGVADVTSAHLFESILADEEQHIDYLETQLGLIDQLGEALYLAQLVEQPGS
jgi:bacterioferritin